MSNKFAEHGALPAPLPDSTVPHATPSFTGTKGTRIVPKRRFQKGTFVKRNGHWVGMWRVDVLQPDGTIKREQRSKTFVDLSERAARAAFQPILDSVNAASGATSPVPKRTATLSAVIREWLEQVADTLKPSTRKTAESHLRRHIEPMLGDCALPELTTKRLQSFATALSTTRLANGRADAENHREHSADSILDCFHGSRLGLFDSEGFPIGVVFASRHAKEASVLCAARYAAHCPGRRRAAQYDLFSAISDRNADRRSARAPRAGLGLSSQADKGPLFHVRGADWYAQEQGEHSGFADAARARIAPQEIPVIAPLS